MTENELRERLEEARTADPNIYVRIQAQIDVLAEALQDIKSSTLRSARQAAREVLSEATAEEAAEESVEETEAPPEILSFSSDDPKPSRGGRSR